MMSHAIRFGLLPFLLLAVPFGPARAQTMDAVPERWEFGLDFMFTTISGNEQLTLLTTGLQVTHLQTDLFELDLSGAFRYGVSQGEEVARNLRSTLSFDLYPEATWSPFVFTMVEQDPFRRLDVRSSSGAGAKYTFWDRETGEVSISGAVLYSYEDYVAPVGAPDPTFDEVQDNGRLSWRFKGEQAVGPDARIRNTTFYQPIWDEPGDYLMTAVTALSYQFTENLAFSVTHSFERDSTPIAEDVEENDSTLQVGLNIKTRW